MKCVAVIPARVGSKGIPDKNIQSFASSNLLEEAISVAQALSYIDRVLVSFDSKHILGLAEGLDCQLRERSVELSRDDASTNDLIKAFISTDAIKKDEFFCIPQPTSPLRSVKDIDECIESMLRTGNSQAVGDSKYDHGSSVLRWIDENGDLKRLFPDDRSFRRQGSKLLYVINGAVYVLAVKTFIEKGYAFAESSYFHEMPPQRSIDIDSEYDLFLARQTYIYLTSKEDI